MVAHYRKLQLAGRASDGLISILVHEPATAAKQLVLVLNHGPHQSDLNQILVGVTVSVRGSTYEVKSSDLETYFCTVGAVTRCSKVTTPLRTVLPLLLGPFGSDTYSDLADTKLTLELNPEMHGNALQSVELWGVCAPAELAVAGRVFQVAVSEETACSVTEQQVVQVVCSQTVDFAPDHIFFWGLDHAKVSKVDIAINGETLYSGPIDMLNVQSIQQGYQVEAAGLTALENELIGELLVTLHMTDDTGSLLHVLALRRDK